MGLIVVQAEKPLAGGNLLQGHLVLDVRVLAGDLFSYTKCVELGDEAVLKWSWVRDWLAVRLIFVIDFNFQVRVIIGNIPLTFDLEL